MVLCGDAVTVYAVAAPPVTGAAHDIVALKGSAWSGLLAAFTELTGVETSTSRGAPGTGIEAEPLLTPRAKHATATSAAAPATGATNPK